MDIAAYSAPDVTTWMQRSAEVGARRVRVNVFWAQVAPTAPTGDAAADPAWSGYQFAAFDAQVRAAVAAGLEPYVNVSRAPAWAEGGGRRAGVGPGSWKPDVSAFGRFMTAVARRYSGSFVDPATGQTLPRVRAFQIWNEPNLDTYLAPQWEDGKPWAPERFRELVNAGYAAVKAAQANATVATAGLAPFGDYGTTDGKRLPPVRFLRSMLCLDDDLQRTCKRTARFDVLAHHPYAVRAPSKGARNPDDVTIPDLGRLTAVTKAARKAGTIRRTPKLWVTEVSYDSSPPDPDGVPTARLARWTAELLWRLWRQGAETVIWYLVRDAPPTPTYAASYQSGMYLLDGTRKASAQAFRFPLVVTGRSSRKLRVWLRSPVAGRAQLQIRRGGRWRGVGSVSVRADGVRTVQVPRGGTTAVRAVVGGEASPAWSVG
ncbi:hypothetical protein [Patulibacter sp. SYSU D01012]|uniref:hypothetical protein n=1 Tax=Patulibacter sp. SYSU D01012 TaxID=2817381 RepID=UPI001B30518B|nr:hypothetical protein [Patulibacter sp. SYSU D01012]